MIDKLAYLACPYSHVNSQIMEARYRAACRAAAKLMRSGQNVYSAISHTHGMTIYGGMKGDWDTWKRLDMVYLDLSESLYVLMLPGWKTSEGVNEEIEYARMINIPLHYLPAAYADYEKNSEEKGISKSYNSAEAS